MSPPPAPHSDLPRRERQVFETLHRLRSATARELREALEDPPSYSAVRATLALLEEKGLVKRARGSRAHVYRPRRTGRDLGRRALDELVRTFFRGRRAEAAALLLEDPEDIEPEELERLEDLVRRAREAGR